jgi:hypothetical protein
MDSFFLTNDVKSELKSSLSLVSSLFQKTSLVDRDDPDLANLRHILGDAAPTIQDEINAFTFTEPDMLFTEFLATLRALKPRYGEHIIDRNGVTYRNCNPVSYTYVDPAEAGWTGRDAFADENAEATEQQLQQAYNQAAAAAERTNRDASRAEPDWRNGILQTTPEAKIASSNSQIVNIVLLIISL